MEPIDLAPDERAQERGVIYRDALRWGFSEENANKAADEIMKDRGRLRAQGKMPSWSWIVFKAASKNMGRL